MRRRAHTTRALLSAGASALAVLALGPVSPADAAVGRDLYVGTCHGASRFTTIQSAVDAVRRPGSTVWVCPGIYAETVTLQEQEALTLRNYPVKNRPRPAIDAGGDTAMLVAGSTGTRVVGLRIADANAAVDVIGSPRTVVRDLIVTDAGFGVVVDTRSPRTTVRDNIMIHGGGGDDSSFGIGVLGVRNVVAESNSISGFDTGIRLDDADGARLTANKLASAEAGIVLSDVDDALLERNRTNFADDLGIYVASSTGLTIRRNVARGNAVDGFHLDAASTGNRLSGNQLRANGTDVVDDSVGSGTAGTGNSWKANLCDTSRPDDLCRQP